MHCVRHTNPHLTSPDIHNLSTTNTVATASPDIPYVLHAIRLYAIRMPFISHAHSCVCQSRLQRILHATPQARTAKALGASLEAAVTLHVADPQLAAALGAMAHDPRELPLKFVFITSQVCDLRWRGIVSFTLNSNPKYTYSLRVS